MATTNFVDKETVIEAAWLNDVDALRYDDNGSSLIKHRTTAAGAVAVTMETRWDGTSVSPFDFGGTSGGVVDDLTAIQAAIDAAGSIIAGVAYETAPVVMVDLGGRTWGLSSSPNFTNRSNVYLMNGRLVPVGTWTATDYVVDFTHTGAFRDSSNCGLINVTVDCNQKSNGVFFQNTKAHLVKDCTIVEYVKYGLRTSWEGVAKNGELRLRGVTTKQARTFNDWIGFQFENQVGSTDGRGIGFSINSADFTMYDCVSFNNMICAEFSGFSNGQVTNNHFFSAVRTTNDTGLTITNAVDNGAGRIRLTVAAGHLSETGDLVEVTGVVGTTEANKWWRVRSINSTTIDLDASTFTNAYVSGGKYKIRNYSLQVGVAEQNTTVFTITGITQANPAVVTVSTTHNINNTQDVNLNGIAGMVELNGDYYEVANVTATTFELLGIDSTAFTAYSSAGTANIRVKVTGLAITNNYLDAQDMVLFDSFDHIVNDNMVVAGSELQIIAKDVAETGDGMVISGGRFSSDINGVVTGAGTWAAGLELLFGNNKLVNGGSAAFSVSGLLDWTSIHNGWGTQALSGQVSPLTDQGVTFGTSLIRWQGVFSTAYRFGAGDVSIKSGTGDPEGVESAAVSSLWLRSDATPGNSLYSKGAGGGTANWNTVNTSDGTTGGTGSAGAGNQFVEINIDGVTYKVLHDGTV